MNILILLGIFIFPYYIDGLLCVANKTYINSIGQFTNELTNTSVNNTIIQRCKVKIILNHQQKMIIKYYGDEIIHETSDFINLFTDFFFTISSSFAENTLTFVCSSEDFCDQKYIEDWSQWLFNINFINIKNDIHQYFQSIDNDDYSSSICYHMNNVDICPTRICYSSNYKNEIINKCPKKDELPTVMELKVGTEEMILKLTKMINLTIETKIFTNDLSRNINLTLIPQLNHKISYFCAFKQCNDPSISTGLVDKIKSIYNLEDMLNFVAEETISKSMNHSTSTTISYSTSTEKTNNANRVYSMSFFAFVIILIFK
jgi:hypothetical protein